MQFKYKDISVAITEEVLSILYRYKQDKFKTPESGGILLGNVTIGNDYYINKVSLPTKFDKSTRTYFERNKEIAQIVVNHEYTNSSGTTIYLGEWHTHPEEDPTPSPQDIKMILDQYKMNKLNSDCIFLLIVGIKAISLFIIDKGQIIKLQEVKGVGD